MPRKKKMLYREWIEQLSTESGVSEHLTAQVWETFLDIVNREVNMNENNSFFIPKFGTFTKGIHKGHPINVDASAKKVSDYAVVKWKIDPSYKESILCTKDN